jgi:hypothetical protein
MTPPTNREISVRKEKILSGEIPCTVAKVTPETRIRWRRSVASSQSLVFSFIRRGSQFPNTGSWPTRVRNGEGFGDPLAEETSATTS